MTWLKLHLTHLVQLHLPLQLNLHDGSQAALAAAVAVLGVVILLELRSVVQLRASVDRSLARVFEQLDLLRFENQQLLEGQAQSHSPVPPSAGTVSAASSTALPPAVPGGYQNVATLADSGLTAREIAERCGLASGEARLLASLARIRRQAGGSDTQALSR